MARDAELSIIYGLAKGRGTEGSVTQSSANQARGPIGAISYFVCGNLKQNRAVSHLFSASGGEELGGGVPLPRGISVSLCCSQSNP